jgi:hypothetical protein
VQTQGTLMSNKPLVFEDFADKLGHTFALDEQGLPAIALSLTEAELLAVRQAKPGARPPFALTFVAEDPRVLPQRIYRLAHDDLGVLEIFLVPIGKDPQGVSYHATFN